jgi:hypothetical protein
MNDAERELTRRGIEAWRLAGPALERIEAEELAHYDYNKNRHLVDALLEIGVRFAQPRTTSGLVELQRVFMKARAQGRTAPVPRALNSRPSSGR